MKRTLSGLTTNAVLEDAPTSIGRALDGFDDIEHTDVLWIERRAVATQGTRVGSHPTPLNQCQHGVRQESRRGADQFRQFGRL